MEVKLSRLRLTRDGQRLPRRTMHAMIAAATQEAEGPRRALWCLPKEDMVLIQSTIEVAAEMWPGIASTSSSASMRTRFNGDVEISLIGNPIVSRRSGGRGIRTPVPIDGLADWFTARLSGCVRVREVAAEPLSTIRVKKPGMIATLAQAGFYAAGTVVDPDGLERLILSGVGHGKAYGLGMLMVAPA